MGRSAKGKSIIKQNNHKLKSGPSTASKAKACDKCHRVKQVCSKGFPCQRCKKNNITCTYDRPQKQMGRPRLKKTLQKDTFDSEDSSLSDNDVSKGKINYSHQGCTSCKKSKKKCDENWPICGLCLRQGSQCIRKNSLNKEPPRNDILNTGPVHMATKIVLEELSVNNNQRYSVEDSSVLPTQNNNGMIYTTTPSQSIISSELPSEMAYKPAVSISEAVATTPVSFATSTSTTLPGHPKYEDLESFMRMEHISPFPELNFGGNINQGIYYPQLVTKSYQQAPANNLNEVQCMQGNIQQHPSNFDNVQVIYNTQNENGFQNNTNHVTPLWPPSLNFSPLENLFLNSLIAVTCDEAPCLPRGGDKNSVSSTISNATTISEPHNQSMYLDNKVAEYPLSCGSESPSELSEDGNCEIETSKILCLCDSAGLNEKEYILLKCFITNVSPLLFVEKTSTALLKTVVPICIGDHRIRTPTLAISAAYISNFEKGVGLLRDISYYRSKALSVLIGENSDFIPSDIILLSLLMTTLLEILQGNSLYWKVSLEKMANLIERRGGIKIVSQTSPLAVQLFCYLDLITSIGNRKSLGLRNNLKQNVIEYDGRLSLEEHSLQPQHITNTLEYDQQYVEKLLNGNFGFRYGIGGEMFYILGNISTLAGLKYSRYFSKSRDHQFNTLSNIIEMKLQNWSPSFQTIANTFLINDFSVNSRDQISSFTIALQWSATLRLHQVRFGYNRKDPKVETYLKIILQSINSIDTKCELESGLLFPLLMAGSATYTDSERGYILERVSLIRSRFLFNYLDEFERLLLRIWSDEEGDLADFERIWYYGFPGLIMF